MVSVPIIGLICWLAIVVLVLAMLRASAMADRAAGRHAGEGGDAADAPGADAPPGTESTHGTFRSPSLNRASVVPWLAGAVTLAAGAVTIHELGATARATAPAVAGSACACLVAAVIEGRRRGRVIERQARELGVSHAATLGLTLRMLALRDPAAARHAAAVGHYARVLARAAGASAREQQIAHSAGLLHDIGRQRFPDELLASGRPLDAAGRRAVREHPLTGAEVLRGVAGLEEVVAAVEAHHERIDGTGYPYGLSGDRIPLTARIVAIAEVYDVLTAADSYRAGGGPGHAARELRRVANAHLDGRLVELFLTVISPHRPRPRLEDELATAARGADRLIAQATHG